MDVANFPLPKGAAHNNPNMIVLHAMGEIIQSDTGKHYYATDWLKFLGISAHRMMTPSGVMIKCREDVEGAYHAAEFNPNSLGIEILVPGVHNIGTLTAMMKTDWISPIQLENTIYVVKSWMDKWDIPMDEVKTHHKIAPDRKDDPGAIVAGRIYAGLAN